MSAVQREYIHLNMNGQHLKSRPDGHYANGGHAGGTHERKRNRETIFLFGVFLVQTIFVVIGFLVFAYFVDEQFASERSSRKIMTDRINALSREIEQLKKNAANDFKQLKENVAEIEVLKESIADTAKSNRTVPNMPKMPPLHGTSEVMKIVTVETVEEYPEIENLRDEREYDSESDEEDEQDEEPQTADNAEVYINGNSGAPPTNLNADISRLRDQEARHGLELQRNLGKQQLHATNSSARIKPSLPEPLGKPNMLEESDDYDESDDEDAGKQTADNSEILNADSGSAPARLLSNSSLLQDLQARHRPIPQRNLEKEQQPAASLPTRNMSMRSQRPQSVISDHVDNADDNAKLPVEKPKQVPMKESETVRSNKDSEYSKPRTARSALLRSVREKRHVSPVLGLGQPLANSISPSMRSQTTHSPELHTGEREAGSASNDQVLWPAVHFNSNGMLSRLPNDTDCQPRSDKKMWVASNASGSEYFDLKDKENITVKRGGLYFVYSQVFFYMKGSFFGYSIKRENEDVLHCTIHELGTKTSDGSGTTCFTAGLVLLQPNEVLRLEIYKDSGKCVRWGTGKSFIGLYKMPQDFEAKRN